MDSLGPMIQKRLRSLCFSELLSILYILSERKYSGSGFQRKPCSSRPTLHFFTSLYKPKSVTFLLDHRNFTNSRRHSWLVSKNITHHSASKYSLYLMQKQQQKSLDNTPSARLQIASITKYPNQVHAARQSIRRVEGPPPRGSICINSSGGTREISRTNARV